MRSGVGGGQPAAPNASVKVLQGRIPGSVQIFHLSVPAGGGVWETGHCPAPALSRRPELHGLALAAPTRVGAAPTALPQSFWSRLAGRYGTKASTRCSWK